MEERSLWFGPDGEPVPMTVNRLADRLRTDADVVSVARLLRGQDADLGDVLKEIIADEHVPFLALPVQAVRPGQAPPVGADLGAAARRGRAPASGWISTSRRSTPAPTSGSTSYWRHRGKLDVPKERFISYPGASPDSDRLPAARLGRLGPPRAGPGPDDPDRGALGRRRLGHRRLTPLLAGLPEVMPWVRQWHGEIDPAFGQSPADA